MLTFETFEAVEGMMPCRKKTIAHATRIACQFRVKTKEGIMEGKDGDYLMRGVQGELYPCDKEIFESSYEFLED